MAWCVAWCFTLLLLAFCAILPPPAVRGSNVTRSSSTVYVRSASVNLTGRAHVSRSVTECACLCEADVTCGVAEYQAERGVCVTSDVLPTTPVHVGLADPLVDPPSPDTTSTTSQTNDTATFPKDEMLLIRQGARESAASSYKPRSCAEILRDGSGVNVSSGVYVIWPDNVTESRVWCDMDTDGGGWTMVYSFKTLHPVIDNNVSHALTPSPTWPTMVPEAELTPRSTTPPNDAHEFGALNFSLWQHVGETGEFMIKSNINNWIACTEDTGSLVRWVTGNVVCRLVKSITLMCPQLPQCAWSVLAYSAGTLILCNSGMYYALEGSTAAYWPVHDPCALYSFENSLQGVWPKGQVWLR